MGRTGRLFARWRIDGRDPWLTYHRLTDDYRPIDDPSAEPIRPRFPMRVEWLVDAFAQAALIVEGRVEDRGPLGKGRSPVLGPDGEPLRR